MLAKKVFSRLPATRTSAMEDDESKVIEHLKKLAFGNSCGVEADILEACDIEPDGTEDGKECYSDEQKEYARYLYRERLGNFLKDAIRSYCSILDAISSQRKTSGLTYAGEIRLDDGMTMTALATWKGRLRRRDQFPR